MKNNKKEDKINLNIISPPNEVKNLTNAPVGNASKDAFCIYNGIRHAVGSKIINKDGTETICTEDGTWQNV